MSKSDFLENAILTHLFQNAAIAGVGDAAGLPGSAAAGSLFVSLHTADPGDAGTQATSEISYTGYARQALARSAAAFTVTGSTLTFVADVSFPQSTGGTGGTVTHFGIGIALSGASSLLYKGAVTPSITVANGVQPILRGGAGQTSITED